MTSQPPQGYRPDEWLNIARKDWKRARRHLADRDPEAAGFFLQQTLEKYLKAFLLQREWNLRKIHELDALLDEAVKHDPNLRAYYDLCERVSGYYMADRYPPLGASGLTCEDIEQDIPSARSFILTMFPDEQVPSPADEK